MKNVYQFLASLICILSAEHTASAQSTTFGVTGSIQNYSVPTGVYTILIDAKGAKGGFAGPTSGSVGATTPGCGGRVQATLAVTPGQILHINVGGVGANGASTGVIAGGYNGGGNANPNGTYGGGGGGGKTDIGTGATTLMVAAGGGGAGFDNTPCTGDQHGGNGGGITGDSIVTCDAFLTASGDTPLIHAGGGKQTMGGAGTSMGTAGISGSPGTFGTGGANNVGGGIGGGGGAGYYGGGGGCWTGGGGGSSFVDASATAVTFTTGNNCGDGIVNICAIPGYILAAAPFCANGTTTLTNIDATGGTWTSGNTSIATITAAGMVTGVAAGTAVISYSISQSCGSGYATTVVTVNVCNVGVKNIRGNGGTAIKLYPNPNNGAFTLFVSSQVDEQALITVTNILGEEVMEYTAIANKAVDIKLDKAAGIYFVNAVTANGRWCQKLTVIK